MSATARKLSLIAPAAAKGRRLDQFLADCLPAHGEAISRSAVGNLIKAGHVRLDGARPKASRTVRGGEKIELEIPAVEPLAVTAEPLPLEIIYEDDHLLVVNKPSGMPVHPSPGHPRGTMVNALVYHCSLPLPAGGADEGANEVADTDACLRPGLVHRLDLDTTGLLLVAKTPPALHVLSTQFAQRTVEKTYLALVHGLPAREQGLIDAPIGRHAKRRKEMAVRREAGQGRDAMTRYDVAERFVTDRTRRSVCGFALVKAYPQTGRTHQVRVHLASIGQPLLADPLYGRESVIGPGEIYGRRLPAGHATAPVLTRHALHASQLAFDHPQSGARLRFQCDLPSDMQAALELLRQAAAAFAER